jgi:hypothetical protein
VPKHQNRPATLFTAIRAFSNFHQSGFFILVARIDQQFYRMTNSWIYLSLGNILKYIQYPVLLSEGVFSSVHFNSPVLQSVYGLFRFNQIRLVKQLTRVPFSKITIFNTIKPGYKSPSRGSDSNTFAGGAPMVTPQNSRDFFCVRTDRLMYEQIRKIEAY